jgi:hypothetical protein
MEKYRRRLELSENHLAVGLLTTKELLQFNLKNETTGQDDYLVIGDAHANLTALRDWCNQAIEGLRFEAMQELVQRPEMQGKTALALHAIFKAEQENAPTRVTDERFQAAVIVTQWAEARNEGQ